MSETRYRANLNSGTVDEIEIVNESLQYVDVRYSRESSATIRREPKLTPFTKICKTEDDAWHSIEIHAIEQLVLAEQAIRRWKNALQEVEGHLAKSDD